MEQLKELSSNKKQGKDACNQNRRHTLSWLLFAALGMVFYQFAGLLRSFVTPTPKNDEYGGLIDIGTISEIIPENNIPKLYPEGRFWLVNNDEGVTAIHSSCTHLDCRFGWDDNKSLFICPCHGSEFSQDGVVLKGPATKNLDRFPIVLLNDEGELLSSQRTSGPTPINIYSTDQVSRIHVKVDTSDRIAGVESSIG